MPKVLIKQSHALPVATVKEKIDKLNQDLGSQYGLTSKWVSDSKAEVERSGVSGSITISAGEVVVDLDLSFLLSPLKSKVEDQIKDELAKMLAKPA